MNPAKRQYLPAERKSLTKKFVIPGAQGTDELRVYVTVGMYPDGRPGEVFFKADKVGSLASGALDGVAMMMSIALQHGVPMGIMVSKIIAMRFEPSGMTGDKEFPRAKSILDYIGKWLMVRFCEPDKKLDVDDKTPKKSTQK